MERTNKKFIKRFQYLEGKAGELGKPLMDMTLAEMDVFGKRRSFIKKRNKKILIFKYSNLGRGEALAKKRGIRKF
jgi:hypothetical protein